MDPVPDIFADLDPDSTKTFRSASGQKYPDPKHCLNVSVLCFRYLRRRLELLSTQVDAIHKRRSISESSTSTVASIQSSNSESGTTLLRVRYKPFQSRENNPIQSRVYGTTLFRVGYTVQPYSEYSWARDNCFASRQRNRASVTSTNKKNGVVSANIGILQESTIFWPENIVTLSRQCCLVPSSDSESGTPQFKVRYNLIFYESDPFSPIMIPLWRIIYYLFNKILNIST